MPQHGRRCRRGAQGTAHEFARFRIAEDALAIPSYRAPVRSDPSTLGYLREAQAHHVTVAIAGMLERMTPVKLFDREAGLEPGG
jgi:hypothetical protein